MEEKKYLLKGDISGIQEFIFNVQSKGAAKTLKAKSYYVSIISDLCCLYCKKELVAKGNEIKEIYSGGGNFFMQISGLDLQTSIASIQQQINKELLYDDISITLTSEELNENDFGQSWYNLLLESNKQKLKHNKGYYEVFDPFQNQEKEEQNNDNRFEKYKQGNEHNDLYRNIIDRLTKSNVINTILFDEQLLETESDFNNRLANKLPFWKDYKEDNDYKEERKGEYFNENKNGNFDNTLIDFDAFGDFASIRTGTNKLGILKMDVDNLGLIFKDNVKSIEEAQTLSREFKDFFDIELYKIWNQAEYKANIYPVFVGGDDCFIIGSWDKIFPFAKVINKEFDAFFKGKDYTLSAGVVIVDPKHPVVSFVDLAEDALSDAKKDYTFSEAVSKAEKHEKNSISIFNEVLSWTEFDKVLEVTDAFIPELENGNINRSVLEKLRNSAKGFHALQQQILREKQLHIPQLWRLKYYLGKKSNNDNFKTVEDKLFTPYESALRLALIEQKGINPAVFPMAARLLEFSTKKKLNYDGDN